MDTYTVLRPFRSKSRPELGTLSEGDAVALDADHAAQLAGYVERVRTPRGGHDVGDHAGGGWYPVLDASGAEVDRVKGRTEAETRAAELDANGAAGHE